jgi:hypothetical protein
MKFCGVQQGTLLQKEMRGVLDRLKPMLGFGVRVTERGGTNLVSILSNKNLWNGQPFGRTKFRRCTQEGEKKEACTCKPDQEWEQKVWEEACAKRTVVKRDGTEVLRGKTKRGGKEPESRKRATMNTGEGIVWGEKLSSPPDTTNQEFLHGESTPAMKVTGQ